MIVNMKITIMAIVIGSYFLSMFYFMVKVLYIIYVQICAIFPEDIAEFLEML